MGDAVGKSASQTQAATWVHSGFNSEPSWSSPRAISWPWLLQNKTNLRKEGRQGSWLPFSLP